MKCHVEVEVHVWLHFNSFELQLNKHFTTMSKGTRATKIRLEIKHVWVTAEQ